MIAFAILFHSSKASFLYNQRMKTSSSRHSKFKCLKGLTILALTTNMTNYVLNERNEERKIPKVKESSNLTVILRTYLVSDR